MLFRGIATKGCNVGKCKRGPRKRPFPHKFLPLPWLVFPKQDFSALQETLNTHTSYTGYTQREGLCSAETSPKGAWWLLWAYRVHSQVGGREHSAKAHFLGVEREPRAQTTETPRTVAANENCCIKTQLPVSQECAPHQGECAGEWFSLEENKNRLPCS